MTITMAVVAAKRHLTSYGLPRRSAKSGWPPFRHLELQLELTRMVSMARLIAGDSD